MPRRLPDRQKKDAGTYRPDREKAPKTPLEAQRDVTEAVKALEAGKKAARKRSLTPRQERLADDKVRVLADNLEIAMEELTKAKAVPKGPTIRRGLRELWESCRSAIELSKKLQELKQPPLSEDEELLVYFGPASKYGGVGAEWPD